MSLLAEIHGKVSSSGTNITERMEDLLTSNIFQLLRYLPIDLGLKPIIKGAANINGENIELGNDVVKSSLIFWKRFKCSEPDIYLKFFDPKDDISLHLFIEAKYHSSKSGSAQFDEDNNYINDSDQLQREWADIEVLCGSKPKALIYLTQDRTIPVDAMNESIGAIGRKAEDRLFWLNWQSIHRIMESIQRSNPMLNKEQRLIITDIITLLKHKGLFDFEGWHIKNGHPHLNQFAYFSKEWFVGYPDIDFQPFHFFSKG